MAGKPLVSVQPREEKTPIAVRLLHAVVFLAIAAGAVATTRVEWLQLLRCFTGPWHAGSPPFWPAVLGATVSAGGAAVLVLRLAQRRAVTLFVSAAIGVGFLVSLSVKAGVPARRSVEAANLALLEAARAMHRELGQKLQNEAIASNDLAEWNAALAVGADGLEPKGSAFRDRLFRSVPFTVRFVAAGFDGANTPPGTVGVWLSDDRAEYTVALVGLSPGGQAALLPDDLGQPIKLRGVFNPDIGAGRRP